MNLYQNFRNFGHLDCPSPVTSPVYLAKVVDELQKNGFLVDAQILEWFGAGLEQGPFEKTHLLYGTSTTQISNRVAQEKARTFFKKAPTLMQVLISAKGLTKMLTSGQKIIAFPSDKHKNYNCCVVITQEGKVRKIKIEHIDPKVKVTMPTGTGYIFCGDSPVLPVRPQNNYLVPKSIHLG